MANLTIKEHDSGIDTTIGILPIHIHVSSRHIYYDYDIMTLYHMINAHIKNKYRNKVDFDITFDSKYGTIELEVKVFKSINEKKFSNEMTTLTRINYHRTPPTLIIHFIII
jgi:hypothetical protein